MDNQSQSLEALLAKKQAIDMEIARNQAAQREQYIAEIKRLMKTHGIALKDLRHRTKPLPRYRDPVTGVTWTGRGREPLWIRGQERTRFLIHPSQRAQAAQEARNGIR